MLHRLLENWGFAIQRQRYAIIIAWVILLALSGWLSMRYADVLSGGGWNVPGSESERAMHILSERFEGRSETSLMLIYHNEHATAGDSAYRDGLQKIIDHLSAVEDVGSIYSILNAADAVKAEMIGEDGHTTYAFVNMNLEADYVITKFDEIHTRLQDFAKEQGVKSYLIGSAALWSDVSVYSQEGLAKAELIVLPLIFLILIIVFRSLVATITPIVVMIASLAVGMGLIYAVGSQVELSIFVTNSAIMLGMGLSIDYSLFMVNRFRIELEKHKNVNQAMAIAMRTSGHTILFSGITVIAAMSALFVVDLPAVRSMAFGAIAVVIFAVLATLSLLPAVLVILGFKINRWRIPSFFAQRKSAAPFWGRFAQIIMKRPIVFLLVSIVILAIFAWPVTDMKLNASDASILPEHSPVRQGIELYEEAFNTGGSTTGSLTIQLDEGKVTDPAFIRYMTKLHHQIAELDSITEVSSVVSFVQGMEAQQASAFLESDSAAWPQGLSPMISRFISSDGKYAVIDMSIESTAASDVNRELVAHIREKTIPESSPPVGVSFALGGDTANAIDMNHAIYKAIVPTLLTMLVLIYFILLITFRSLLLPLKAILMNLLSVGATFGIVTWVFAEGHGIALFNATASGYVTNFAPLLMLALLFGLSTDYEVFLISRVQEHYEESGNNEESVAVGLQATGPLITGAALLMIAVFSGFAFSSMLPIQTIGFGMAVAILLDATIVRLVIVPAAMKLMGRWNWWLPVVKQRSSAIGYQQSQETSP
jgi:RND superfamily putative drug exporter